VLAPTTDAGRAGLAALREAPDRAVVALDYDGTLAPVVARPQDACRPTAPSRR
jgi:trehalose 6-phosphate phosphatase